MAASPVVWILFADALAAPEVVWSLRDAGRTVVAVIRRGGRVALSHSRHVRLVEVTDPALSVRRSLSELTALLRDAGPVIVMPLDDLAVWLVGHLDGLPLRICGPTGTRADAALDKRLQFGAARRAGFGVPWTGEIASAEDLSSIPSFPCIVKPALAARVIGGRLGRGRAFVISDQAAARRVAVTWSKSEPMLAQGYLRGIGEGLFGLVTDDGVVAWSAHRRLRMMNPAGSGSSACTSRPLDPATCVVAERFLRSLEWRGLFMIEFLRDSAGALWFMELNGRPWGSMALARRAGYEYPAWSVEAIEVPHFSPPVPTPGTTIVCRHLARELIHLVHVFRGPGPEQQPVRWPKRGTTVVDMIRGGRGQAIYNWRADDPLVLFADLAYTLRAPFRKRVASSTQPSWYARFERRLDASIERGRQARLRERGLPASLFERAGRVLFVCYGNINRSALAERLLTRLVGARASVASGGFHDEVDRPADPPMVALASSNGVDLDHWSSRRITDDAIDDADLIFAMEAIHLTRLHREFPSCVGRTYLLGSTTAPGAGPLEIRDPFGGTASDYQRCFGEVLFATSALAASMTRRSATGLAGCSGD